MEWSTSFLGLVQRGQVCGIGDVEGTFEPGGSHRSEEVCSLACAIGTGGSPDALFFAGGEVGDDFEFFADVDVLQGGHGEDRQACLTVRRDLDDGSPCLELWVDPGGLICAHVRDRYGSARTFHTFKKGATSLGLDLRGDFAYLIVEGEIAMGAVRLDFGPPFWVGVGARSGATAITETATFSHLYLEIAPTTFNIPFSVVEIVEVETGLRKAIAIERAYHHFESPRWSQDGGITVVDHGQVFHVLPETGELRPTGQSAPPHDARGAVSPDGRWLAYLEYGPAVKDYEQDQEMTLLLKNLQTGEIRDLADLYAGCSELSSPCWSPDGRRLVFVSYASV